MLETIDLSARLSSEEFKQHKEQIQRDLNRALFQAWQAKLGIVVIIEGWNFSGKADCVRYLTVPMDPRGLKVHVVFPPTREERRYPFARRYWEMLPPRGHLSVLVRSWYYHALEQQICQPESAGDPHAVLDEIRMVEKMLADDGYLILKFWLHIDRKTHKKRRKQFKRESVGVYRVGPYDPKQHKRWDRYTEAIEDMLAATDMPEGRWFIVPSNNSRYAQLTVAQTFIQQVDRELARRAAATQEKPSTTPPVELAEVAPETVKGLRSVDLTQTLQDEEYADRLLKAQHKLAELQHSCVRQRRPVVLCLEGWDAAGKGGIIRRLTTELDPRYFTVHPIAAPRGEEADQHYLWRFWKRIPPDGHWAVFDRTWYGRVLVERVEGFATESAWRRAYSEIRAFETALHENGVILLKFWLHISPEEQLRRFREREQVAYKNYKITKEDWRNRDKRPQYETAVDEMIARTSMPFAPWHIVPSENKNFGRVTVLETCVETIGEGLKRKQSRMRRRF